MVQWTIADAAHLLRRAGFGGSRVLVDQLHAMGRDAAIDWLLDYESIPDDTAESVKQFGFDRGKQRDAMLIQLFSMAASPRPLREKLAWFWHGHFVSALGKAPPNLMLDQMDTWRAHASGAFLDFLYAMYKDPAMLVYLDNNSNVVGHPNENFAREVMELFTLGVGNYSETDIKEAARAFTGWKVLPQRSPAAIFVPRLHDTGRKTVLGVRGNLDGDAVMRILYNHPATATRICTRLYQYFVMPRADAADLGVLVSVWNSSGGDIRTVLETLFRLDSFWSEEARNSLMKSPVEYAIGLYQRLQVPLGGDSLRALLNGLVGMGQTPLSPPDVAGYPEGIEWAATSNLLARYNGAYQLAYGPWSAGLIPTLLRGLDTSSAASLLDGMLDRLGPLTLSDAGRAAILTYLVDGGYAAGNSARLAIKARGALHLIASTPEYQLN